MNRYRASARIKLKTTAVAADPDLEPYLDAVSQELRGYNSTPEVSYRVIPMTGLVALDFVICVPVNTDRQELAATRLNLAMRFVQDHVFHFDVGEKVSGIDLMLVDLPFLIGAPFTKDDVTN